MTENSPNTPHQQAHESAMARLDQFPSDPIAAADEAGKEVRIKEMDNWAKAIGAHTERLARAHRSTSRQIIESARMHGKFDSEAAKTRLSRVPSDWRTGVKVDANGDVRVHDHYPYSGDTPAEGWHGYRSPRNIRK